MAHDEVKGGLGGGCIGPGIVYILGEGEPVIPGGLPVVYKDAEILLKPLICLFQLTICLGVVSSAYVLFDVQDVAEFAGKVESKAGIMVGDDSAGGAVMRKDVLDIEGVSRLR